MTSKIIALVSGILLILLVEGVLWAIFMSKIKHVQDFIPLKRMRLTVGIHTIVAIGIVSFFISVFWST